MARSRLRRYFRHGLLPQLIAFEACVRLGGVTRAAEELALAQPTISGLLRKLADTVGAPLMYARGGRVELTDEGRRVLVLCGEVLDSLSRFEARLGLLEGPDLADFGGERARIQGRHGQGNQALDAAA